MTVVLYQTKPVDQRIDEVQHLLRDIQILKLRRFDSPQMVRFADTSEAWVRDLLREMRGLSPDPASGERQLELFEGLPPLPVRSRKRSRRRPG